MILHPFVIELFRSYQTCRYELSLLIESLSNCCLIFLSILVSIIACEDRLIRILNKSVCEYEIETYGIPNMLYSLQRCDSKSLETMFIYGTLEGKTALVSLDFSKNPLKAIHKWEIPEKGSAPQVSCLAMMETTGELYIGRSDGSIEVWVFSESLEADGSQSVSLELDETP